MSPPMTSSLDLAASVCALPRPLMFLETAAFLDIMRVPFRHELQVDIVDSAAALVDDLAATPKRIWVVSTSNVLQEFQANREAAAGTRYSHLQRNPIHPTFVTPR